MKTPKPFHPHILLVISHVCPRLRHALDKLRGRCFPGFIGIRRQNPGFMQDSRAFTCKTGVEPPKKPFHPLISLRICSWRQVTRCASPLILPIAVSGVAPFAHGARTGEADLPIKYGGGSDLSPRCHPVPPFHSHRHALLDRRPDLRVMKGPRERFVHGEQTEADREDPARC